MVSYYKHIFKTQGSLSHIKACLYIMQHVKYVRYCKINNWFEPFVQTHLHYFIAKHRYHTFIH
jgi:hypothetical protein